MKPSPFTYVLPSTVDEAVEARSSYEDTVVLAGGQSLVPTLNFRLANPEAVIDLRRVPRLAGVEVDDEHISVGAMTRQRELELDARAAAANPLVGETLTHVAHPVVRNRGTVGGSIAHADPAAELPCLLVALDGDALVSGRDGSRRIAGSDLFEFIMTTSLAPDEILTEVRFPVLPAATGWAFAEFSRRHGDFALAGVAVTLTAGPDGTVARCRAAACGVSTTPVRLTGVESAVTEGAMDEIALRAAAAVARDVVTVDDDTASGEYRKDLLVGLVARALVVAAGRARRGMEQPR